MNDICFSEQLTFLKYVNERYLFYGITIVTFASLFCLVWILKTYTYFEKRRIVRASLPTFPFGNFKDVIKQDVSLHMLLWKYYNKFKRKRLDFGGIFIFTKPAILAVNIDICSLVNNRFPTVFPRQSKLTRENVEAILKNDPLNGFLNKFDASLKNPMQKKLLNTDIWQILRDFLFESCIALFGFDSPEIAREINRLAKSKFESSKKFYLTLCFAVPFLRSGNSATKNLLAQLTVQRKKDDSESIDLIASFIALYNEIDNNFTIEEINEELINLIVDVLHYSYSGVAMCLHELADRPEIQKEIAGEVRRFNQSGKEMSTDNIEKLVYLDAVVKETFRKYPAVPTIISRGNDNSEFHWNPDKKTLIFQSILATHRDPKYYVQPESFDPDRFIEDHQISEETYLPFGTGAYNDFCMKLTVLQTKLMLTTIFSCCRVRAIEGKVNQLKFDPKLLYLAPKEDFNVELVTL